MLGCSQAAGVARDVLRGSEPSPSRLFSVLFVAGLYVAVLSLTPLSLLGQRQVKTPPKRDSGTTSDPRSLYASASRAVVTIIVLDRSGEQTASGSGVVVSSDGKIVTNYHLVAGGTFFEVRFPVAAGANDSIPGRPVACAQDVDLAMLEVTPDRRLPFARKAAALPSVGERVLAIGSPLGLEGTLSDGVVSQLRELDGTPLIQTTAQISPGSSGGGLFLYTGDLVGITTMTLKGGQGLNFAVPIESLGSLRPCSRFPDGLPAPPSPTATPTPPRPDCKEGLGVKYMNVSGTPGYTETSLRLTGVISNKGCAAAEGVKLRVEVFEEGTHEFIVSRTFTLTRASFPPGELLDVDETLALPYGTGGKSVTVEYHVRDLAGPF